MLSGVSRDPSDIDGIFRRLTEISAALASVVELDSPDRRMLEAERATLRRRAVSLAGGKDSHRSIDVLRAELAAQRERLITLHDKRIPNVGRSVSVVAAVGLKSRSKASIDAVNEAIMGAGSADEIRARITEIVVELKRRGEVMDDPFRR